MSLRSPVLATDLMHVEIAADFGISETTVRRWVKPGDTDDGTTEGGDQRRARPPIRTMSRTGCHVSRTSIALYWRRPSRSRRCGSSYPHGWKELGPRGRLVR